MEYRRDTTLTQDHMTSLRRNGRTNPPLLRAVRMCFAVLAGAFLFLSFVDCLLIHHCPSSILLALVGDDHLIVVTCLVRADTLASHLSYRSHYIILHEPSSPQDSSVNRYFTFVY